MRVAIFGGSFNPPHVGHQLVALYVLETAAVDELWFVPCWKHPFDKALEAFSDRLRMCELAAAALGSRVHVSDVEAQLGGEESPTLLTIKGLQARHPEHEFLLVIGADLEPELPLWYGADELRRSVQMVVVGRGGLAGGSAVAMPAVSSTEVRARLLAGEAVEGLIPRSVGDYIRQRGIYAKEPGRS
jgi:nicotinate-nucleotide adenylyltransferase